MATKVRSEQDLFGLLFTGDLRIKRKIGGVFGGLSGPYNNTRFAFIPQAATIIPRVSRMRHNAGSNLSLKSSPTATQFGVAFDDAGKATFELALRSEAVAKTQGAGSASAQPIVIDQVPGWYKLPHEALTANPIFTGASGSPALVIGDTADNDISDEIDLDFGYFYVREGAANISAGDTIESSYSYGALDGYSMDGDQVAENVIWAEFVGENESEGIKIHAIVRNASVTATAEMNFAGNDAFANFDFSGEMSQPGDGAAAYSLKWWRLAA